MARKPEPTWKAAATITTMATTTEAVFSRRFSVVVMAMLMMKEV